LTVFKYYLSAIFLFVILIVVPYHLFFSSFDNGGKVEFIGETYSPNKQLKAVEYLYMGGGAIGFCKRNLSIQKHNSITPTPSTLSKNVFSARCGVDVAVSWINDEELKITYLTKDLLEPNVKLNAEHSYNRVSIEYKHDI
jgi:hypothetical protein